MSDNNETASQDPTEKAESIFLDMLTPKRKNKRARTRDRARRVGRNGRGN